MGLDNGQRESGVDLALVETIGHPTALSARRTARIPDEPILTRFERVACGGSIGWREGLRRRKRCPPNQWGGWSADGLPEQATQRGCGWRAEGSSGANGVMSGDSFCRTDEQIGSHQPQRLQPGLRDPVDFPLADGRLFDLKQRGGLRWPSQCGDDCSGIRGFFQLRFSHARIIGAHIMRVNRSTYLTLRGKKLGVPIDN